MDYFVLACEILFIIFTVYYTVEEALEVGHRRDTPMCDLYLVARLDPSLRLSILQDHLERARCPDPSDLVHLRDLQPVPTGQSGRNSRRTAQEPEQLRGLRIHHLLAGAIQQRHRLRRVPRLDQGKTLSTDFLSNAGRCLDLQIRLVQQNHDPTVHDAVAMRQGCARVQRDVHDRLLGLRSTRLPSLRHADR